MNSERTTREASLAEQAYLAIRESILRGKLTLGSALSRRKLTGDLNMSLVPISRALQRLEDEGLVESRPRVGTRVRIPTPAEVRESYIVREALECQSARLFSEGARHERRIELKRMAEHVDVLFNRSALDSDQDFLFTVHSYHFQFHMCVAEWGGCEALKRAIEKNQVLISNWVFDVAGQRKQLPIGFHANLAGALCRGEPAAAEEAMRNHVRYGLDEIVRAIQIRSAVEWRSPYVSKTVAGRS